MADYREVSGRRSIRVVKRARRVKGRHSAGDALTRRNGKSAHAGQAISLDAIGVNVGRWLQNQTASIIAQSDRHMGLWTVAGRMAHCDNASSVYRWCRRVLEEGSCRIMRQARPQELANVKLYLPDSPESITVNPRSFNPDWEHVPPLRWIRGPVLAGLFIG